MSSLLGFVAPVIASTVAIVPVYATIVGLRDIMREESFHKIVLTPQVLGVLCFGTSYAATGNAKATLVACVLSMLVLHRIVIQDPEVGYKILDVEKINKELGLADDQVDDDDAP